MVAGGLDQEFLKDQRNANRIGPAGFGSLCVASNIVTAERFTRGRQWE